MIWQFGLNFWINLMGSVSGKCSCPWTTCCKYIRMQPVAWDLVCFLNNRWHTQRWLHEQAGSDIVRDLTVLEFFPPILVAICLCQDHFKNQKVLFCCDNQAAVKVINRQTSHSEQIMQLVCKPILTYLLSNISFSAKYISSISNGIVDTLSQFQEESFWELVPTTLQQLETFVEDLWGISTT